MPTARQEFVIRIGEENGEERKKERFGTSLF
jgi:hypothetical protein